MPFVPEAGILERLKIIVVLVFVRANEEHAPIILRFDIAIDAGYQQEAICVAFFIGAEAALAIDNMPNIVVNEVEVQFELDFP